MAFNKFAEDDIEPEQMDYSLLTRYQSLPQEVCWRLS